LLRMLSGGLRLWEANDDTKPRVMGVGAFNLVERSMYETAGGMEALRMEVADDVGLAQIVSDAGGRCRLAASPVGVWIRWYRTVADLLSGTEKACAKAGSRAKLAFGLCFAAVVLTLELFPFVAWVWWRLAPGSVPAMVGLAVVPVSVCTSVWVSSRFRMNVGWALLPPVSTLIAAMLVIRGVVLALCRGGVQWKGDRHTLKAARDGERVQL